MRRLTIFLRKRRFLLGIAGLLLVTAPVGFRDRAFFPDDEARDAAIAKEMAQGGDYLHPRLAGRPVPEKPFFFYAAVASSYRVSRRITPSSTRLPSVLFSALTLLAGAAAARLLFSPRAALIAASVLATTYLFAVNAHDAVVDVALTAFVAAGFLAFVAASRAAGKPRWGASFGLAAAGALLVKGPVGPLLLALLTLPLAGSGTPGPGRRRLPEISTAAWAIPAGTLLFWIGTLWGAGGAEALQRSLWHHQVGRFLGFAGEEYSHHRAAAAFYLAHLPAILFPWSIVLPAAVWSAWKTRGSSPGAALRLRLAGAIALATLFLSAAGTKRTVYFLPVVPIAALLAASHLDEEISRPRIAAGASLRLQALAVAAAAALVPLIPALEDRRVTLPEAALVAGVALLAGALFLACRSSAARLIAATLVLAVGSLVLVDRCVLPRLDPDGGSRVFLTRVERRLTRSSALYAYRLNEDALGRACLGLPLLPLAEDDTARLGARLAAPNSYALADIRKIEALGTVRDLSLEPVETGWIGGRAVALYERRTRLARKGS
jgi:4-amino-4-deoxy-L-arabinose transferase-like glycosyltransferase